MKFLRNTVSILLFFLCTLFLCADFCYAQIPPRPFSSVNLKSNSSYSLQQGLQFIENKGQLADQFGKPMPEVLYSSDSKGMKCYLTKTGMHFIFSRTISPVDKTLILNDGEDGRRILPNKQADTLILQRLEMEFTGANPHPRIEAQNISDGYFNYYLAHCKLTGVRGYSKVIYHDLYPNIDLVIYSKEALMKYDFIVHCGGDPKAIRMKYSGMDSMLITNDGKFKIYTPLGKMEEDEPYTYQNTENPNTILSHFLISDNELHFQIGNYDKKQDLVIDPIRRMWGTYFGGSVTDQGQSPVVDKENNIIFCGTTQSTAGIATTGVYQASLSGAHDVFMAKFTPAGAIVWATYFGGSSDELSGGMAIDSNEYLLLYGETHSSTGIATAVSHQTSRSGPSDEFIAKFDDFGMLQWATYFGGDAGETVVGNRSIACDRGGHIYITGSTFSRNGLSTVGAWDSVLLGISEDCFLAKFNSSGLLLWSTYYGGASEDHGWAIATDGLGNVYLGGSTASTTGISTSTGFQSVYGGGQSDAFLAKFSSYGGLLWATYYGGSGSDYLSGLCTDSAGNIYACGYTTSTSGIASAGAYQTTQGGTGNGWDALIVKFNPAGKRQWGTFFGGENNDFAEDIVINSDKLLISGETASTTGISTVDGFQNTKDTHQFQDALLAKFSFSGSRLWATYYGGIYTDYGYGCALDREGNLILVGETVSTNNIATPGSYMSVGGGVPTNLTNIDAYLVKLCDMAIPILTGTKDTICVDGFDTLRLNTPYEHTNWFDGSTPLPNLSDSLIFVTPTPQTPGAHSISVHVSNGAQCDAFSDTVIYVVVTGPIVDAGKDTSLCTGMSVDLSANVLGGKPPYTYSWTPVSGLSDPHKLNPKATPSTTTTYHLFTTDKRGCSGEDSVTIKINPPPQLTPKLKDTVCFGKSIVIGDSAKGAKPPYIYSWLPKTGLSSTNTATPVATPIKSTTYTEVVTDSSGCQSQALITITVIPNPNPVIEGPNSVCINSDGAYFIKGNDIYHWALNGGGTLTNSSRSDSVTVLWATAGTWVLTVSDTNAQGCTADTSFSVNVSSTLMPTITPDGNVSFCSGDSIILYASKGYTSYKWSNGATTDSIIVKQPGKFSVAVTSNGGCSGTSAEVIVTENPSPVFTVTADGPTHLCTGSSVHLTASAGFNKYLWSTGETTPVITVSAPGSYTVQVTNGFGCVGVSSPIVVIIDANLTPVITPSGALSFCQGDSVTLDAGVGYSTYQWSKNGVPIPLGINEKLVVGQSGSYTVAVTSASCSGISAPSIVVVFPLPSQPIITQSATTLTSTSGVLYQWYLNSQPIPGATSQNYTETKDGSYTVKITDGNGCSSYSLPFTILSKATATVKVGAVSLVNPGGKIEVPIELSASQNLIPSNANHYVGSLRYNGTMIVPTGSNGGIIGTSSIVVNAGMDRTIGFQGMSAPLTSGTLQKIQFDAMLGNDTCTKLVIDTFFWTDADVTVTRENGEFCETGICIAGGGIRLLDPTGKSGISPIRPNPSSNYIIIEYDLLETGRTKILLSDALGRVIHIVIDEDKKAGHYKENVLLEEISSGYYQILLKTPSQYFIQSFVVQK